MRFFKRPDAPGQAYAGIAGTGLLALGALSFARSSVSFGTVDSSGAMPEFLLWSVNGWTAAFWLAIGSLGVLAAPWPDGARLYCLVSAVVFSAVARWGEVDGDDVAGLLVADTTNNVTHAVLAVLGLLVGLPPRDGRRRSSAQAHEGRGNRGVILPITPSV